MSQPTQRKVPLIQFMLAVLIFTSFTWAQSEERPLLGVKAFENPSNSPYPNVGAGLTDLFMTELHKTGKYRVVERAAVEELLKEIALAKSGYVDKKTGVRKGHIQGMEYLFYAKVTQFGAKQQTVGTGGLVPRSGLSATLMNRLAVKKEKAEVRIDFRVIDATTGETVMADFAQGEEASQGLSVSAGSSSAAGGLDIHSTQFLSSMVGRATVKAMQQIIYKMDNSFLPQYKSGASRIKEQEELARKTAMKIAETAPGRILALVDPSQFVINLGSVHGLKPGDKLDVYREIHTKDKSGKIVYTEEKRIGEITVTDIQNDRSKATAGSGSELAEGDIVKKK